MRADRPISAVGEHIIAGVTRVQQPFQLLAVVHGRIGHCIMPDHLFTLDFSRPGSPVSVTIFESATGRLVLASLVDLSSLPCTQDPRSSFGRYVADPGVISAVLSIITGGGKWVEITIPMDPLYLSVLVS